MVDHEAEEEKAEKEVNAAQSSDGRWSRPLKKKLSDKEILSQTILFLAAGYETTATTLSFLAYNLAMNPEYQTRIMDEVDQMLNKNVS